VAVGVPARARAISAHGDWGRTGHGEVDPFGHLEKRDRSKRALAARVAATRSRLVHRREKPACAGIRQRVRAADLGFRPLCRIASGVGFATRELYSDQDEDLFEGARPLILNGIEDIVDRPDLAERSLFFICGPIRDEDRRSEDELWAAFDASHPLILGALLDAVATGLKMLPNTRPLKLPRMADFAQWATACEPALWPSGAFRKAYYGNLEEAVESVLEADPIAVAVRAMLAARTGGDRLRSSRPFDRHRG